MQLKHIARIGTSGFSYDHWRGVFYPADLPKGQWLEFYAEHFNAIEINSTFYHLPRAQTLVSWRERTPPNFLFVLKGSRFVTHIKRLTDCEESVALFYERATHLEAGLGAVLWQLPPGLSYESVRLTRFLELLPGEPRPVLEFRHPSWFTERVFDCMKERGVSLCLHDMPASRCPDVAVGPLLYLRFHGPAGLYRDSYGRKRLVERAETTRQLAESREVYAFFNNDSEGHAVTDARRFREWYTKP